MEPIIWDGEKNELCLLDQRILPHRTEYINYRTAEEVAGAIRDMVVRGAPAIGITGAFGMVLAVLKMAADKDRENLNETFYKRIKEAYESLKSSRPTAVNLRWGLDRMINRLVVDGWLKKDGHHDLSENIAEIAAMMLSEAGDLLQEDIQINKRIGENGAALVPAGAVIITHCNAGALATGGWGTALGVIRAAHRQNKIKMVYADETRPYLQGSRLTALELQRADIPVTIVTDSCAGYLMQEGRVDMVITGADRITARGDVANKIGTYSLAVLANYHRIPFYVAAPLSTFDYTIKEGSEIIIEERDAAEITTFNGTPVAPAGVPAFNPSFDVTPAGLVTAIITENGIINHQK